MYVPILVLAVVSNLLMRTMRNPPSHVKRPHPLPHTLKESAAMLSALILGAPGEFVLSSLLTRLILHPSVLSLLFDLSVFSPHYQGTTVRLGLQRGTNTK